MDSATSEIAGAFVRARQLWKALSAYPGQRPVNLAEAYAIQDKALEIWDRPIGGWKVGKIPAPASEDLGANRLIGPVFADAIKREDTEPGEFRIFEGGFAAIEAEFMLRLAPKDAALPSTPEEAKDWVDEIRIGLEVASSPYSKINEDGPCVTISDHGNNAGLFLGQEVPRERWNHLDDIEVTLSIEGSKVGKATTATMLDGPFGAVKFLLRNLVERGIEPKAGWWVSSGAITGVHPIGSRENAVATFQGVGTLNVLANSSFCG